MKSLALAVSIVTASASIGEMAVRGDGPGPFKITTKRQGDRLLTRLEKETATVSIHSESGIGEAVIELVDDHWPSTVVLHLHLKGLESLRVSSEKVTLEAAVSSSEGMPRVRVWKDGDEGSPLDSQSPYWLSIRVCDRNGKPVQGNPKESDHFAVTLPRAFLDKGVGSITLKWIDFYRN